MQTNIDFLSVSHTHTHTKISRWKITADQSKHKREEEWLLDGRKKKNTPKIILKIANLQFLSLSEEVNSTWPLVLCKQPTFFPRRSQGHRTANSGQVRAHAVRWRGFGLSELIPRVKPHTHCSLTACINQQLKLYEVVVRVTLCLRRNRWNRIFLNALTSILQERGIRSWFGEEGKVCVQPEWLTSGQKKSPAPFGSNRPFSRPTLRDRSNW